MGWEGLEKGRARGKEARWRYCKHPVGETREVVGLLEGLQHFGLLGFHSLSGTPEITPYVF